MTGDGKTALRASTGIFYNFPRSTGTGGYSFAGGCPVSCSNAIRYANVRRHRRSGDRQRTGAPADAGQSVNVGGYEQPLAKSYNANVAFQRDIGFNTTAEIAWVGNYQYEGGRTVDINRLPLYVYAQPGEPGQQRAAEQQLAEAAVLAVPGHGIGHAVRPEALQPDRSSTTRCSSTCSVG